ncbi:hypothetical protein BDM02DRAFT_74591 [Thelephora ganbajun]|uniref:Uncharacterized protein n=1 Tax=Thelephora ganbajun TaxID=370292 RepID=A0ACB6ZXQ6_THEGA|nr:hypothetical protein BDM02DRAFT_74591 [Thelephora ganbajun]
MPGEGESDDSTTIRRRILLSPTMPPRDSMDHDGSPLANLIGQCLERNAGLRPKIGDIKKHTYFFAVNWQLLASQQIPVPPSRILDSSNVFTPSSSFESFSSQSTQEIPDSLADISHSLNDLDLDTFSFRWDLGLDCEDEDESVSDYGTVLHTGETNLSAPLTTATGLSAVEEITESGLTDSRTSSTANQPSLRVPPGNNEPGLLPSHDRKDLEATKDSKSLLNRLRETMVSDRLVPCLSIPWSVLVPTPPVVKAQVNSSGKPSAIPYPRPKNKLRKKTRPSIAITLAVEPPSSFSLAQQQGNLSQALHQSLEALQTSDNSVPVSPVVGFPSATSFLSFQLPPVFSKARSRVLQKSKYRPSNDTGTVNRASTVDRSDVDSSGSRTHESGGCASRDIQPGKNNERIAPVDDNGVGGFPTPIRSASCRGQSGGSREETSARERSSRISTSWELGLGLGQDLGLRVCSLWRVRGG